MPAFKPQQRRLVVGGRSFHFVSYEATPANARRQEPAVPAMWFLMVEGRRLAALPCDPEQPLEEVDAALAHWITSNALAPEGEVPVPKASAPRAKRPTSWWGPD
jgi:hypothetical protein